MSLSILPTSSRDAFRRQSSLAGVVGALAVLAVLAGVILLLSGILPGLTGDARQWISAAPLLLVGLASFALQVRSPRPAWELVRHFGVTIAFLLWGIDELLPPSVPAETVGHVVIVLYVVDLALTIRDRLPNR